MPEADANGVRLYYELHGSGEPLALVQGAWADATAWRFVVPGLAKNFRVLSYDRRGHSREIARLQRPVDRVEELRIVSTLAFGECRAVLVGCSVGGQLALASIMALVVSRPKRGDGSATRYDNSAAPRGGLRRASARRRARRSAVTSSRSRYGVASPIGRRIGAASDGSASERP